MLTLQFIQFHELQRLNSRQRIKRIIDEVKDNKIVLVEGRLRPEEETQLIEKTMEDISKDFKGIELCTLDQSRSNERLLTKLRLLFASLLIGDRRGMTVIGPATIIKEIKRDPNKVQLLTTGYRRRRLG
ncbi:MAG: DUF2073 domain-containing protein [Nanoarchaeota archaeon]